MTEPMKTYKDSQPERELENKLESFYETITPEAAFVSRLDRQIAQRSQQLAASKPPFLAELKHYFQHRPAFAISMAVLLILILTVSLMGPQKVLASVQRLLGFVPGTGFVQPGETRLLASPVEVTQGEVTLRIEKVIAGSKQTEISLTASGLPMEKFEPVYGGLDPQSLGYLLLPDGRTLGSQESMSSVGDELQASYIFGPLPEGVTRFSLVLPRLPSLPADFAPEGWSVPIQLVTVQVTPGGSSTGLPVASGYVPANNLATAKGVSVELAQVGQTEQESGLQVQYRWDNPEWFQLNNVGLSLSDSEGHSYSQLHAPMELSGTPASLRTYRFEPFLPGASQGILSVDELHFTFKSQAYFDFNPREDMQIGQLMDVSQEPGSQIEIAGVPVQVLSVTIVPNTEQGENTQPVPYRLVLILKSTPVDGLELVNTSMSINPELLVSGLTEDLPGQQERLTIDLPQLPRYPLRLYFPYGEILLNGHWMIQWNLPGK